ncbi:MAG TPA: alpha/beta fold hydrolase [Intrasporangium sp.]|uniref:alpha/beta hydrolase n=1 Tax=Intrasporangium sp. TaxID=1925024 RepID=UPI002D78EE96|nr:alpha/beta fold hydrolase [Intrasporangium sp.]HET7397437.1 alpha/beta fold hydrolase [Intrasporangium sp.]
MGPRTVVRTLPPAVVARRLAAVAKEFTVPVLPGAEPFLHHGGTTAVLMSHGFTGSPVSVRAWAEHLAEHGHTVSVPLLPGHGTTWRELNRTTWQQWYAALDDELRRLAERADHVFVAGLSMGGALALRLAEEHGSVIKGLVLVNPAVKVEDVRLRALPLLMRVVPALGGIRNDIKLTGQDEGAYDRLPLRALHSQVQGWAQTVADLGRVDQPLLLFRSRVDHVVPASSSALVLSRVSSTDVTEVVLEESYHVATMDNDAPLIFERTVGFLDRIAVTAS